MATRTIAAPATEKETDDSNFVSLSSLKSYATATASLTMVINVITYVYKQVQQGKEMSLGLVVPIAIFLSVAYIISFFKKDKKASPAQHVWITALNSIMLFTSISGVNSMLDSAQLSAAKANATKSEQSIGDFFKHVFLPTHGWFNITEMDDKERSKIIQETINSIDSTQKVIDTLITQKQNDLRTIDTLHNTLDSVRHEHITTLTKIIEAEKIIQQIQTTDLHPQVKEQLTHVQNTFQVSQQRLELQKDEDRELHRVPQQTSGESIQHLKFQRTQLQTQKTQLFQQRAVQQINVRH